jgi:dUTP pyrophosphatase
MGSNSAAVTTTPLASTPIPPLLVKKLTPSARAPTRGSAFAAGYDLYSAKEIVIPAKGKGLVDTGLAIAVPEGTCMFNFYGFWFRDAMNGLLTCFLCQ